MPRQFAIMYPEAGQRATPTGERKMKARYCVKLTSPEAKVSYLTVKDRFSWTKARAVFHAQSSSVLKHFEGYKIEVVEE